MQYPFSAGGQFSAVPFSAASQFKAVKIVCRDLVLHVYFEIVRHDPGIVRGPTLVQI